MIRPNNSVASPNHSSATVSVVHAVIALVCAALLLCLALATYWVANETSPAKTLAIAPGELRAAVGRARVEGKHLIVRGHKQPTGSRLAILSTWQAINSADFRFLSLKLDQASPDLEVELFWRPAGPGDELYSQPLPTGGLGRGTIDLTRNPDWRGHLAEIGLLLTSNTEAFPVTIADFSLHASGMDQQFYNLLSEWTARRKFDQATINRLEATFSAKSLSPVLAAALWGLLALLIVMGLNWRAGERKANSSVTGITVLLAPWVFLDLLWQHQLANHLDLTRHLFHGKPAEQRQSRSVSAPYHEHAKQLKSAALPATPVKLFILHDSVEHDFQRLWMQYYLLPHNVYNHAILPPADAVRPGDYLLALGDIPGLLPDAHIAKLAADNGELLPVKLEHSHPLGKLYRVVDTTPGQGWEGNR